MGGVQRIHALLQQPLWSKMPADERTRCILDLFIVSVLLDAGAGDVWKYKEQNSGQTISRSEGLAVASLDMFLAGVFSSDGSPRADGKCT